MKSNIRNLCYKGVHMLALLSSDDIHDKLATNSNQNSRNMLTTRDYTAQL